MIELIIDNEVFKIDKGIFEVVKSLNEKGFRTKECCEGHKPLFYTYILFWNSELKDNIPLGFKSSIEHGRLLI